MSFKTTNTNPSKAIDDSLNAEIGYCLGAQILTFRNAQGDGVIDNVRANQAWERETYEEAVLILKQLDSGVIIDVGANCGAFVLPLAKTFAHNSNFVFHAFEPQRMIFNQLCGGIALNGLPNVIAHCSGCGKNNYLIDAYLPQYLNSSSSYSLSKEVNELMKSDAQQSIIFSNQTDSMQIIPIDSLSLSNVVLIKIDVEGMELDVLNGAITTITDSGYPPILYESWRDGWRRTIAKRADDWVTEMGYSIRMIGIDTAVAIHPLSSVFTKINNV